MSCSMRCWPMQRNRDKREELISAVAAQLGWPEERVDQLLPDIDDRFYDSLDVAEFVAELDEEFSDEDLPPHY